MGRSFDISWIIFGLLVAMCGVVGATFFVEERPAEGVGEARSYLGHGTTHPEYETLSIGGPGAARHEHILWLGTVFGLLLIAFFMACLAFGGEKHGRLGPLRAPLTIGGVIFAGIYLGMIFSYRRYMHADTIDLVWGFPRPTAWMIYGMWAFPVVFIITYIVLFDRWIFSKADAKRFREIVGRSARPGEAEE